MDSDTLWATIEAARDEAGFRLNYDFEDRYVESLRRKLAHLSPNELVEFQAAYARLYARADVPAMRAAAWVIDRDRNFEHFASAVIASGRESFERTVVDPDWLSGDPVVRTIAANDIFTQAMFFYWATGLAESMYRERVRHGSLRFQQLVDVRTRLGDPDTDPDTDDEQDDDDDDLPQEWDDGDERQVRQHLPRLTALFDRQLREANRAARRERVRTLIGIVVVAVVLTTFLIIFWANGWLPDPE